MFSSATTRAKTSLAIDVLSYNVCFSIVFSLSWSCPCIPNYCAKQENFTQWFNALFLAAIPAYHVSLSLLPQQSAGLHSETDWFPDPAKRQHISKRYKERKPSLASAHRYSQLWPYKLSSAYKRQVGTVQYRCRNEQQWLQVPKTWLLPTTLQQTVWKGDLTECTYLHKHPVWIMCAEVSIIFKHRAVYGIKYYISTNICRHRTKLMQLMLLKTLINKPQSTHATHNLITSKDSKRLELFEVGFFFHKSNVGRWVKPHLTSHTY